MFKLAASEEKIVKVAFAKKAKSLLAEEIGELTRFRVLALKNEPGLDVSDLDYYIQLRKDAM